MPGWRRSQKAAALVAVAALAALITWAQEGGGHPLPATFVLVLLAVSAAVFPPVGELLRDARRDEERWLRLLADRVGEAEGEAVYRLLGRDWTDRAIDLAFDVVRTQGAREADATETSGTWSDVTDFFRGLDPARLVVTGPAGAGKSSLALKLLLDLLRTRGAEDPVPVRVSAAHWPDGQDADRWLAAELTEAYGVPARTAQHLLVHGRILPIVDVLDEMDADPDAGDAAEEPSSSRSAALLTELNRLQVLGRAMPMIVLCRTERYALLAASPQIGPVPLRDSVHCEMRQVPASAAARYLERRATVGRRWRRVCEHLLREPDSRLGRYLANPWRLNLVFTAYDYPKNDPNDLLDPTFDPVALHDALVDTYVHLRLSDGARYPVAAAKRWLGALAAYLEANRRRQRTAGGAARSGTDIVLHELWPIGGVLRVRRLDLALFVLLPAVAVGLVLVPLAPAWLAGPAAVPATLLGSWLICVGSLKSAESRPKPTGADLHRLREPQTIGRALGVTVAWAVPVTVIFGEVSREDGYGFGFTTELIVPVAAMAALARIVAVPVERPGRFLAPRSVLRDSAQWAVWIGAVTAGVSFYWIWMQIGRAAWPTALTPIAAVAVAFGAVAFAAFNPLQRRYAAMLLVSRRRLPLRLGRFLDWSVAQGVMRQAGAGYQFRHMELQRRLARRAPPETRATAGPVDPRAQMNAQPQASEGLSLAVVATSVFFIASAVIGVHVSDVGRAESNANVSRLTALCGALSDALSAHDEKAFLAAATPSARPVLEHWWANLALVGFDKGAVAVEHQPSTLLYPARSWTVTLGAGVAEEAGSGSSDVQYMLANTYQVTVGQNVQDGPMQISSWNAIIPAPWDEPGALVVEHEPYAVVVGAAGEGGLVRAAAPSVETASAFVQALARHVDPSTLLPDGPVVFVSADPTRLRAWFGLGDSGARQAATMGADVEDPAPLAAQLSPFSLNFPPDVVENYADNVMVAAPATGTGTGTGTGNEGVPSVPAMTAAVALLDLRTVVGSAYLLSSIPQWAAIGFATYAETLYLSDADAVEPSYPDSWLKARLRALAATYHTATPPTDAQLDGADGADWSYVAASVFAYIADRYGAGDAFDAGTDYRVTSASTFSTPPGLVSSTPFGNVSRDLTDIDKPHNDYPASTIQAGWSAWSSHGFAAGE